MKPIKMLGLAALIALMATACLGVGSAMAETTALCAAHEDPCGNPITHVHETGTMTILNSVLNVTCNVLFLGDALNGGLGNPLVLHGSFTYSSCHSNCVVTQENGLAELKILRLGHETSDDTYQTSIHMECQPVLNCRYSGVGMKGTGKGPLLATEKGGEVTLQEQVMNKESGLFCPSTSKLDLRIYPLSPTHVVR